MEIKRLEVGQMKANCYLVINDKDECLIIDPGDDAEYITRKILELGVTPISLLATHGHFDHLMAALELKLMYEIPFYMHKADEFLLKRVESSAKHFLGSDALGIEKVDKYLSNGEITVSDFQFEVLETPGHTPGSVCLYSKSDEGVFVGDLVFDGGNVGRYDFKYSNKNVLYESIRNILKLPDTTKVYPGHGDYTSIGELRESFGI